MLGWGEKESLQILFSGDTSGSYVRWPRTVWWAGKIWLESSCWDFQLPNLGRSCCEGFAENRFPGRLRTASCYGEDGELHGHRATKRQHRVTRNLSANRNSWLFLNSRGLVKTLLVNNVQPTLCVMSPSQITARLSEHKGESCNWL